jgi:hypothetical protein
MKKKNTFIPKNTMNTLNKEIIKPKLGLRLIVSCYHRQCNCKRKM